MFDLSTGKLFIRKRNPIVWMLLSIIVLPFLYGLLFEFVGLPDMLKFGLDGIIILLVMLLIRQRGAFFYKQLLPILLFILGFFVYTLLSYSFNFQSVLYYIWGFRNNFRMYIAFLLFASFLTKRDADDLFHFFDVVHWINFAVCLIQYFILGYKQDYLGGVFGVQQGCNGYINIFMCIVVAKTIIFFLNKKEGLWSLLFKVFSILLISALAELKFFIVEFIIIVLVASLVTKFSWRKLLIIVLSVIGTVFGIIMMIQIFPEFAEFFTFEIILDSASSASGYTFSNDLNRLTALTVINKEVLTTPFLRMFGLGMGNCDLSSIAVFNTPFYESHQDMNYNWFSHAFMYLETGYIGMILFFAFFVFCFIIAHRRMRNQQADRVFCQISMIMCVLCFAIAIYGSSLRSDAGYMAYFIVALPFINYVPDINEHALLQQ